MNCDNKTENFWTFISKRLNAEAALADWRLMLGDKLDFDKLQRHYLAPTGKMANLIMCPEQCNPSCGFRKVCEWEGQYEAVCREWPLKSYKIEKADALFFTIKPSGLLPKITKIFKIIPHIEEFNNEEDTWKQGVVPMPGGKSATVYLTLKVWNHEIMDLIFRLNCAEHKPYILLVPSRKIIHGTSEKVLNDMGSAFVPLNEVLDFNAQTEFKLIRECNLSQLVAPLTPEPEPEPENIFRKCGDAWEVRFQGGEKFLLPGANVGAAYINFLLSKPNTSTPVTEIMFEVYGGLDSGVSKKQLGKEDISSGYSLSQLPNVIVDAIADDVAMRQYKKEMTDLVYKITDAENRGDDVTAKILLKELKEFVKEMEKVASVAGQNRRLNDPLRKIDNAFRNAINRTIIKIAEFDRNMAKYFKRTITCGMTPIYTSDKDMDWDL